MRFQASLLAPLALAAAPSLAAAQQTVEFDLAGFSPFTVSGEVLLASTVEGEIIDAHIDATLAVQDTGPWTLSISFSLPTGGDGFSSDVEGWSGPGTFSTSFRTDAFNGPISVPRGAPFWSAFAFWNGGAPLELPGGGFGLQPLDGVFEELKLTLIFAPCPLGDPVAPWTDLGGAVTGSAGAPALAGSGSLCSGESGELNLAGAAPRSSAVLVIGTSALSLPVLDGLLVPTPELILPAIGVDAAGAASAEFVWPAAQPSGTELWLQYWIVDPLAPAGLAASNGLRAAAP